jgi:YggT family protein
VDWLNPPFSVLSQLTDPYLNVFRSIIPPLGGIDLSPILAFLLLTVVQRGIDQIAMVASSSYASF